MPKMQLLRGGVLVVEGDMELWTLMVFVGKSLGLGEMTRIRL